MRARRSLPLPHVKPQAFCEGYLSKSSPTVRYWLWHPMHLCITMDIDVDTTRSIAWREASPGTPAENTFLGMGRPAILPFSPYSESNHDYKKYHQCYQSS